MSITYSKMFDDDGVTDPDKVLRSDGVELIRLAGSEYWDKYELFLADGGVTSEKMPTGAWDALNDIAKSRLEYAKP